MILSLTIAAKSDLYPQLPRRIPDYPRPVGADPYRLYTQMDLPMTIRGGVIPARPDSGCEENIMSAIRAEYLDLPVSRKQEHRKSFRMANGRTVEASGKDSMEMLP